MEMLSAAILGIIQGLTEFLPISSSAHLIIVPWFLGWKPEGLAFDVSLHVGTAIAVLAFFWTDWVGLCKEVFAGLKQRDLFANQSQRLFWFLVIGTIPAMIAGLLFEKTIEVRLRSPLVTVFTLAVLGAMLFFAERKSRQNRTIQQFTWADAIWIGLSQAIALIPGVSRSGITITTAMFCNADRTSAARFSFLLSTPIIVGAGILQGYRLIQTVHNPASGMTDVNWIVLATGIVFSAITGFLCIRFFLRYLQTNSFVPFIVYRIVLAIIILIYYIKYF